MHRNKKMIKKENILKLNIGGAVMRAKIFCIILITLLVNGCSLDGRDSSQNNRIIIIFVDYDISNNHKNNIRLWKEKISPIAEEISDAPFTLKIYPLYQFTENGNIIYDQSFQPNFKLENKTLRDIEFRRSIKKYFDFNSTINGPFSLKTKLENFAESCKAKSNLSKIIDSLGVLKSLLSDNQFDKNNIYIIYISDLIERHQPSAPWVGRFNFLKPDGHTINILSINAAIHQIKVQDSWLGKKLKDFPPRYNGVKIYNILPDYVQISPDAQGNGYSKIIEFWKRLFQSIGMDIQFNKGYKEIFRK
jgi:hypothetical protein